MAYTLADLDVALTRPLPVPTARWWEGPDCLARESKAYVADIADYVAWVRDVERHVKDPDETAQRLRLLHYGRTAGNAMFDKVLDTTAEKWSAAPLTTAHGAQESIDGLMRTGLVVSRPSPVSAPRPEVDVSHVWVAADAELNGFAWMGHGLSGLSEKWGAISWTGDLASWWSGYNDRRLDAIEAALAAKTTWSEPVDPAGLATPTGWLDGAAGRSTVDDLFGDMDGLVLRPEIASLPATPTPFADLLESYYGPSAPRVPSDLHCDNRFHLFVRRARPAIPHTVDGTGAVTLDAGAHAAIRVAVTQAVRALLLASREANHRAFVKRAAVWGVQPLVDRGLVRTAIVASLGDVLSPWGRAMMDEVARRFTEFLAAGLRNGGWWTGGWAVRASPLDAYGGYELRFGDNDTGRRFGGADRAQEAKHVANLQKHLVTLGFAVAGTPDGVFGPGTAMAVRELQIEAREASVVRPPALPVTTPRAVPAALRFHGRISGVVDRETAAVIEEWLAPAGGGGPNTCGLRVDACDAAGVAVEKDIWRYNQVTDTARRMRAVDTLERYPIPLARVIAGAPLGTVSLGRYTTAGSGGPVLLGSDLWPEAKVTGASLLPLGESLADGATASRYRVIRAVAQVECGGFFDSVNAWDGGRVSIGLYHWIVHLSGTGELAAFLAYYKHEDAAAYHRDFGRWGLEPERPWDPAVWGVAAASQAKYVGRLVMYGLHDGADVRTDVALPLDTKRAPADAYVIDWLRGWHSLYRWVMALRTSEPLQRAQWGFSIQRLVNLLGRPWHSGPVTTGPVVADGAGGHRVATFGEVFTSERAVAGLLRYHVNRPAEVLDGNGATGLVEDAYEQEFGTARVVLTDLPQAEADVRQEGLVGRLVSLAPTAGSYRTSVENAVNYVDAEAGALARTAGSFQRP